MKQNRFIQKQNRLIQKLENNRNIVLIVCVLCFFLSFSIQAWHLFPLSDVIYGHDSQYHYLRTAAVKSKIQNGGLFTGGIDYLFLGGSGYASSAAYPSLFLYIPALLDIAGLGTGLSMKIFILIASAAMYFIMFRCMYLISRSCICGSIGASIYILSVYMADDLYIRFALGEYLAFLFWPLIIYGLYDLAHNGLKRPWILGAGFSGMLLTHTLSTVVAAVFAFIFFLCNIVRIFRRRGTFIRLCITAAVSMCVTAYYWMPFLEMLTAEDMAVSHPTFRASSNTVDIVSMFGNSSITGIGIFIFLAAVPRIFLTRKSPAYEMIARETESGESKPSVISFADAMIVTGFVTAFFVTNIAPWEFLGKYLDNLQFTWRLYSLVTAAFTFGGTIYVYYLLKYTDAEKRGAMVLTALASAFFLLHSSGESFNHGYQDESYYDNPDNTYAICMAEWVPDAFRRSRDIWPEITKRVTFEEWYETNDFERTYGRIEFSIPDSIECSSAEVPFVWYKGYQAFDDEGNSLDVSISENGLLNVDISGVSGKITVYHKNTAVQNGSMIFTFISLAGCLTAAILFIRKKMKTGKQTAAVNDK